MKTTMMRTMAGALVAFAVGAIPAPAFAENSAAAGQSMVSDARATVVEFQHADPGLSRFFDGAVAYAVFPSVGKGGAGIGGAYGRGVLFEQGRATGRTSLTQVTVGMQLGGQAYSEIVFFETGEAVEAFKKGQLAMSAQVSAVVAAAGASANARYARGVAVFTLTKGGLMAEVSVGGQKFGFRPFAKAM